MEVLRVQELRKSYKPRTLRARPAPALQGFCLEAVEGEVLGLVGPNGAGKTTFFRILLGLLRPDAGSGHILGQPLGHLSCRRLMGYLPERFRIYPSLSVEEILRFAAELAGLSGAAARNQTDVWSERLGLRPVLSKRLGHLSKGWLQRVGLAQAFVGDPGLLVLDEPLSGLDPMGRAEVRELISSLAAEGKTILLSSHILPDVEAVAHRVAFIADGRILETIPMSRLLDESSGETEIQIHPPAKASPARGRVIARDPDGWERWVLEHEGPGDLEKSLSELLAAGARIRAVQPRSRGLESRLFAKLKHHDRRVA